MKTVPPNYLLTLVRHLQQTGLAEEIVEQALGTDLAELENAAASGNPIPLALYGRFYRFYLQKMAAENFGFPDQVGDMTGRYLILYRMMVNSKNLGSALDKLYEFYKTFSIDRRLLQITHRNDGRVSCTLVFKMHSKYLHSEHQAIIIANLCASFHRVMCWLTGTTVQLQQVDIAGPVPRRAESYESLFECPVNFATPQTQLLMDASVLNYGIVQTEQTLEAFLQTFPEPLFSSPQQVEISSRARIEAIISHNLNDSMPPFADICRMLNQSPSQVKRQLQSEGTSYHKVIEQIRKQQAIKLLTDSTLELGQISEQLGFPASSAFHRSFKRWTGMTPGEYRAAHLQ